MQPLVASLTPLQRLGARDQPLRIGVGRHLDQRAIKLDAATAAFARSLEGQDDFAGAAELVFIRREYAVDDGGMCGIDQTFRDIVEPPSPTRLPFETFGIAERIGTVDRHDAGGPAEDDESLLAISKLQSFPAPLGAEIGG